MGVGHLSPTLAEPTGKSPRFGLLRAGSWVLSPPTHPCGRLQPHRHVLRGVWGAAKGPGWVMRALHPELHLGPRTCWGAGSSLLQLLLRVGAVVPPPAPGVRPASPPRPRLPLRRVDAPPPTGAVPPPRQPGPREPEWTPQCRDPRVPRHRHTLSAGPRPLWPPPFPAFGRRGARAAHPARPGPCSACLSCPLSPRAAHPPPPWEGFCPCSALHPAPAPRHRGTLSRKHPTKCSYFCDKLPHPDGSFSSCARS